MVAGTTVQLPDVAYAEVSAKAAFVTVTALAAAAVIAILASDHGRRLFGERLDLHGQEAQNVLVDPMTALHFVDHVARAFDVEQRIMRLARFLDRIGEVAQAPIFGAANLAVLLGDDLGDVLDQRIDLLGGDIGSGDDHVFVESHILSLLRAAAPVCRRATAKRWIPRTRKWALGPPLIAKRAQYLKIRGNQAFWAQLDAVPCAAEPQFLGRPSPHG